MKNNVLTRFSKQPFKFGFKSLVKPVLAFCLVFTLVFGTMDSALAARSGGRIGGGSFRAPRSTYVQPRRSTTPSYGGGYGYGRGFFGGGFGFPFLLPFFGFGGGFGGLFTILIFIAIANFIVQSVRGIGGDGAIADGTVSSPNPKVTVAKLQVGLLANAKSLQADLNRMAQTADTGSSAGLAQVLQEATLSLLRHPEYWVYGNASSTQIRLNSAETEFNRLALIERSKFSGETVSNVNNQIKQANPASLSSTGELAEVDLNEPGEYIVATLLVAATSKLDVPTINSDQDLRRAISQIGSVGGDDMMAVEILWSPQAEGVTLSADEMIAEYPDLKRL
ncbi:MAG: DUF1517 domain-containing protein [Merismopedia sp. SIO2A8]|nr:DUF1517 domain-containing protein [Symploca sp. SIO2B6]NET47775.1 DUF1517 domain-containing protein [Merismopedia sp. SIO2A8]